MSTITYPPVDSANYIYVGGFGTDMDESSLLEMFITFGEIKEVFIPRDNEEEGRNHRGFGFVQYEYADDAKSAIENMHMNVFSDGNVIKCNLARPMSIAISSSDSKAVWDKK